jgi:hypothetical protein
MRSSTSQFQSFRLKRRLNNLEIVGRNPYDLPSKIKRRRSLRSASLYHLRVPPRNPDITSIAGRQSISGRWDKSWLSLVLARASCQSTSHCPHHCPTSSSSQPSGSMRLAWQLGQILRHDHPWLPIFYWNGTGSTRNY